MVSLYASHSHEPPLGMGSRSRSERLPEQECTLESLLHAQYELGGVTGHESKPRGPRPPPDHTIQEAYQHAADLAECVKSATRPTSVVGEASCKRNKSWKHSAAQGAQLMSPGLQSQSMLQLFERTVPARRSDGANKSTLDLLRELPNIAVTAPSWPRRGLLAEPSDVSEVVDTRCRRMRRGR